jgi:hypothetical protein
LIVPELDVLLQRALDQVLLRLIVTHPTEEDDGDDMIRLCLAILAGLLVLLLVVLLVVGRGETPFAEELGEEAVHGFLVVALAIFVELVGLSADLKEYGVLKESRWIGGQRGEMVKRQEGMSLPLQKPIGRWSWFER